MTHSIRCDALSSRLANKPPSSRAAHTLPLAVAMGAAAAAAADATSDAGDAGAASFSGRTFNRSRKATAALSALPPEEARVRAIAEVVNALIQGVQEGKDVDLNLLKTQVSSRSLLLLQHASSSLLLLLQQPPTYTGGSSHQQFHGGAGGAQVWPGTCPKACGDDSSSARGAQSHPAATATGQARAHSLWHCCGGGHEQATQVPTHRHNRCVCVCMLMFCVNIGIAASSCCLFTQPALLLLALLLVLLQATSASTALAAPTLISSTAPRATPATSPPPCAPYVPATTPTCR